MRRILFLFCWLLGVLASAQPDHFRSDTLSFSSVSFDVTSPFTPYASRIRMGYQQRLTDGVLMGLELGKSFQNDFSETSYLDDFNLFEARLNLNVGQYVWGRKKVYWGGELYLVQNQRYLENSSYYEASAEVVTQYQSAEWTRVKTGANLFYGILMPLSNHLMVDVYAGVGLRYRKNEFNNLTGIVVETYDPWEAGGLDYLNPAFGEGEDFGANFTAGVRLRWSFKSLVSRGVLVTEELE